MAMVSSVVPAGRWMKGLERLMRGSRGRGSALNGMPRSYVCVSRFGFLAAEFLRQAGEAQVDDRGGVEGQQLAEDQAADDGDAERAAELGAHAGSESQRHSAEERGHGGHDDGAEA